jgi:hypothetical protein
MMAGIDGAAPISAVETGRRRPPNEHRALLPLAAV